MIDAGPARTVAERGVPGPVPIWSHPEWEERFPWLMQGTTGRGDGSAGFDLGLFGSAPTGEVQRRWRLLLRETGFRTAVHSHQVHGAVVAHWHDALPAALIQTEGQDGHLTTHAGTLLTASIADCVPLFLVAEDSRVVGVVHAGWRGVAGGIVEVAIEQAAQAGAEAVALWLHAGPAICGDCYEVGPEVHRAVNPGAPVPDVPHPIDLRAAIARRSIAAGARHDRITISEHCTRCGPGEFFSHRGGSPLRQMGIIGRHATG